VHAFRRDYLFISRACSVCNSNERDDIERGARKHLIFYVTAGTGRRRMRMGSNSIASLSADFCLTWSIRAPCDSRGVQDAAHHAVIRVFADVCLATSEAERFNRHETRQARFTLFAPIQHSQSALSTFTR
jgi:hypothetical protein